MDIDVNSHPEPLPEEWANQVHLYWPTIPATLEAQERTQQLQDTYERYHALATVMGQIIWTARADGMVEGSPFWRAYTGQSAAEVQGLGWTDVIHPQDRLCVCTAWRHAIASKRPFETEYRLRRADGVYHPFLMRAVPRLDVEGNVREWVGSCTDISERKQLEQALQASEAHFRASFEREQQARIQAETTAQRLRDLQALMDTALEHLALEDLLHELLDRIREVMAVDATTILLLSPDGKFLTMHARSGEEAVAAHLTIPFGQGIAGTIAASQKPLIVDEVSNVAVADPFLRAKLRSLVGVPLLVKGRVIGVMHVGTTQPHRFTQDDVQLLEMVAQRIALAIDHAHLFRAEQQARSEAAAHASQLEATIEAMTEGVGIYTPEGYELLTNRSGQTILGIDDPERFRLFTSQPHPKRIALLRCRDRDGNPYPPARSPLTRALQGEVVPDAESEDMLITALDGHERYLSSTAAPIYDAEGQLAGAVFVYRDVTERRLLERRTHDVLGALLDMAEALVAPACPEERLFDEDTGAGISSMAQRLAELTVRVLGYERVGMAAVDPETTQMVPLAVVSPSSQEKRQWWERRRDAPRLSESVDPLLLERLSTGEVMSLETRYPPFREPHPFRVPTLLIAPMCVGNQLVGLLSIGHDNPEQVYTPQDMALAGAVAQLTALVIERDHLLQQREEAHASVLAIREANRQLETFLGMASHELKTPLTSILMGQEMLQRRVHRLRHALAGRAEDATRQVEAVQALMDTTHQQAGRLNRLVNDLLDTSRIQAGRLPLQRTPVDLATIVRSAVEEQRQVTPERRIQLHLPSHSSLPVRADAERIRQVVTNYLTNALKYSAEERPVEIGVQREGEQGRVWVRDQGPGIPESEREHLWERFHRVPGIEIQSGSGIGLGLGLYISKTIIEQHGGHVGVQSTRGAGATFWFTLPLESPDQRP